MNNRFKACLALNRKVLLLFDNITHGLLLSVEELNGTCGHAVVMEGKQEKKRERRQGRSHKRLPSPAYCSHLFQLWRCQTQFVPKLQTSLSAKRQINPAQQWRRIVLS